MPIAAMTPSGISTPDGQAYDVKSKVDELLAAQAVVGDLDATELGYLNSTTAGTVAASKAVVVDANKDIGEFRNVVGVNFDAGKSGAAGTVDIFPTTGSKGKLAISAADNAGDTTTAIVKGAQAGARTYTIPDALASAMFLLGTQGAVARTATALGDGTGLIADAGMFQFIACTAKTADATGIITLPTPTPGTIICGYVGATGFELRSSAPGTVAINGGTSAAAESAIGANMFWLVVCTSATSWHGLTITGNTLAAMQAAAD